MLDAIGFPFARYTIGSCFGVRASVYAKHGGMNRHKAGEDFYFLNKLFPHVPFISIHDSCVSPSPRPSTRVPFGTGPVIRKLISSHPPILLTYSPGAFTDLGKFFEMADTFARSSAYGSAVLLASLPEPLRIFLQKQDIEEKLDEIRNNTANEAAFVKRFFLWFDGFKAVKYLNFVHERYYTKMNVEEAALQLLRLKGYGRVDGHAKSLLLLLRELDGVKEFRQ